MLSSLLLISGTLMLAYAATAAASFDNSSFGVDPRWTFAGCFSSGENHKLLKLAAEADCMTHNYCYDQCQNIRSFTYFGLKSGKRCYCGNSLDDASPAPNRMCTWKCGGDRAEKCGSDSAILVMQITNFLSPVPLINAETVNTHGSFVGCFVSNEANSALRHKALKASCMTQAYCRKQCVKRSFKYFGLRLGTECYCGHILHGLQKVSVNQCSWKCEGNAREQCGSDITVLVMSVARNAGVGKSSISSSSDSNSVSINIQANPKEKNVKLYEERGMFEMLKLTSCDQASTHSNDTTCEKAIDGNTSQDHKLGGSCAQGQESRAKTTNGDIIGWWRTQFDKRAHVLAVRIYNRQDCCAERLNDFSILVDRSICVRHKSSESFSVKLFQCEAVGNSVMIDSNLPHLTLCEVQVFGQYV